MYSSVLQCTPAYTVLSEVLELLSQHSPEERPARSVKNHRTGRGVLQVRFARHPGT
jgi:hypothetical protein